MDIFEWKVAREKLTGFFSVGVGRPTRTSLNHSAAGPIYTLRRMVTHRRKATRLYHEPFD